MANLCYPVVYTPDDIDGRFVVTFPHFKDAITQGNDIADAKVQALDCLLEAFAGRMNHNEGIRIMYSDSDNSIELLASSTIKILLYCSMRSRGISYEEIAIFLEKSKKYVMNLMSLSHQCKLDVIEKVLKHIGIGCTISFGDE